MLGASAIGQVFNIVLKLLGVTVFLHFWGRELYGEWLILLTIPSYLSVSGTGLSNVAAVEMVLKTSNNLFKEALAIFQSVWVFVSLVTGLFLLVCTGIAIYAPVQDWFSISHISPLQLKLSVILLGVYTGFFLQCELLVGAYRAHGIFAKGIFGNNLIMLFENLAVLLVVVFTRQVIWVVITYAAIRIIGTITMAMLLRKRCTWFKYGYAHVRRHIVKSSLLPTASYLGINMSNAFTVQGVVTVIGITLGASAVVAFTVIRTLINLVKQLNGMIYYSISPEFSTALAVNNTDLAKKLHRYACQITMLFTMASIVGLLVFGEFLIRIWTNGKLEVDYIFFGLMLFSMMPNTFYVTSSYVHASINRLGKIAVLCIITSSLLLLITYYAIPVFGINAVPMFMILLDMVMLFFIVRDTLRLVQDNTLDFIQGMFDFDHLRNLRRHFRLS